VRWQVTKLGDTQAADVGAAEITLYRSGGLEPLRRPVSRRRAIAAMLAIVRL